MSDILLGWPSVEDAQKSRRPFARTQVGKNRFADLSHALAYERDGHLVTFAPTGAGKGVRAIIPNLLHYDGPVITVDPKGENFAVTARYRHEVLGQDIFLLDPFEYVKTSLLDNLGFTRATLNPLDLVQSFGSHIETQLTMLAALFAGDSAQSDGDQRFWDQVSQNLIAGVIGASMHIAREDGKPVDFQGFIDLFYADDVVYNLARILDTRTNLDRFSYRSLAAFLNRADKERSGVLSTVHSYLTPFLSAALNRYLNSSTIPPARIAAGENYTIYIVIPPSKLISHAVLLRLWIATMLSIIVERDHKPLKRTLFMLDECAQLGSLEELKKAITLMRGYGLQVWMFFQDVQQIEALYPDDWETMVNNCGVLQAFGVPRNTAGKSLSKIVGRYKSPDLVQLDRSQQVVSVSNREPRILRLMNYLEDKAFSGRFDINPLFGDHGGAADEPQEIPPNSMRIHY
jgi:type IV secretion system protein VirD4